MNSVMRSLGELCDKSIEFIDPKSEPEKEFLYVDISAVDNSLKRIMFPQRVKGKEASVRARQLIQANDVLVSTTRPNLNAVALVPGEYDGKVCSTGFCVLRATSELDPGYLFAYVRSASFVQPLTDLVQGALYPAVTNKQVLAQSIPWVPLDEQCRIATRLKAQLAVVEEAKNAARAQIRDSRLLIPTILKATFAEAADAEMVKIGDVAPTTSGTTPSRSQKQYWEPAKYPWVKTGEVAFEPICSTEEKISEKALQECSLSLLPPGTVMVAMYGQGKTRGQSAVLEVAATTNQACFAILPNDTFEPEYLQFWLRHSYDDLRALSDARGGNQSNLNGSILNAFEVPLLPREQQRRIAKHIKAAIFEANTLQSVLENQLTEIDQLPSRLLSQAFDFTETGANA